MRHNGCRTMFATLAAFISPLAFAATTTWDALDFARCTHWSLTDDAGQAAEKQVKPLLAKQGKEWFAVGAWNFTEDKSYVGVCRFTGGELTCMDCLGGDELKAFPIAGTTFVMSNFRTGPTQPLPTYNARQAVLAPLSTCCTNSLTRTAVTIWTL
jgi:hypothetical protein